MTSNEQRLTELNEGRALKPYTDTVGKLTVGVGHNLTDRGVSSAVIDLMLLEDYTEARNSLLTRLPWVSTFDDVRKAVLTDLVFNLGITKFLRFRNTIAALKAKDWTSAGKHLRQSLWYQQVGQRGPRIINMLISGRWPWDTTA